MSELDFDEDDPRDKKKPSRENSRESSRDSGRDAGRDQPAKRGRDRDDDYDDEEDDDRDPPPRRRKPADSGIGDYFSFKKLFCPGMIQLVFWIGVGLCVALGIYVIYNQFLQTGIGIILIGSALWRFFCELMVLAHRNLEMLTELKNSGPPK